MDKNTSLESYPSRGEVDRWLDSIWDLADATECPAELLADRGFTHNLGVRHTPGFQYIRFSPAGMSVFFGYWQPALSCPAPLPVHVPGYGAEMDAHSGLVAAGFNVLHISPSVIRRQKELTRRSGVTAHGRFCRTPFSAAPRKDTENGWPTALRRLAEHQGKLRKLTTGSHSSEAVRKEVEHCCWHRASEAAASAV